jgi:hypothetical protein
MMVVRITHLLILMIVSALLAERSNAALDDRSDIRNLSSHFNPGEGPGTWKFHTSSGRELALEKHERDLKDHFVSPEIHPGLLTIRHSGADEQIKGTIGRPIGISEFHIPWEFELEILRDFWTTSSSKQSNYAHGLNVALTFSDPASWPAEMTSWPPDTHWFQLLIVHLGTRGSSGGLPQYGVYEDGGGAMGERWLVWGRGDLDPSGKINGDWGIPTIITGDGRQDHGPASTAAYLNFTLHSPTVVSFGVRFGQDRGFYTHEVPIYQADVSKWGKATGVWEVGPVIAESSWILNQWPGSYIHGPAAYGGWSLKTQPTSKGTELYVGFCDFQYSPWGMLPSIEVMTNDFNIPGYIGRRWQVEFDGVSAETWSHPGYLTLTSRGINNYWGGTIGQADLSLSFYPAPWEFEICVRSPDDTVPWNIHLGLGVVDVKGKSRGGWTPGIVNFPGKGRQVGNVSIGNNFTPAGSTSGGQIMGDVQVIDDFGPSFPAGIPKDILDSNPIYLMARVIDSRRLQMGVRARQEDPWFLTPVYECGFEIRGFWQNAISMYSGRGAVDYTQLLIDYWHYREGLSGPIE